MARPRGRTLSTLSSAHVAKPMAPRLDRRDHRRLSDLVADRACPSLFHTREQTDELLESPRLGAPRGSLGQQARADAVEDGADEEPHGAARLPLRAAFERQPRLR